MDDPICVVTTTTGSAELAANIARELVKRRLAACVQVMPIVSHYVWDGDLREDPEHLLIIKSRASGYAEVAETIRELHTYDVPQILKFDVSAGSEDYLGWVRASTGPPA